MKTLMHCTWCGSQDVRRDAYAAWDVDEQEWVLAEVFDAVYCANCEGESKIAERYVNSNEGDNNEQ